MIIIISYVIFIVTFLYLSGQEFLDRNSWADGLRAVVIQSELNVYEADPSGCCVSS